MQVNVNGRDQQVDIEPDVPLLWVLRDVLQLTGTKFGCGIAACGACTVHVDGQPLRSCVTPVAAVAGRRVTTIESLAQGGKLHALQEAWIAEQVPQCVHLDSSTTGTGTQHSAFSISFLSGKNRCWNPHM